MNQQIAENKRTSVFRLSTKELVYELNEALYAIESKCFYPADELDEVYLKLFGASYHIDRFEEASSIEYDTETTMLMIVTCMSTQQEIIFPIIDTIDEDDGMRHSDARSRLLRFRGILADM